MRISKELSERINLLRFPLIVGVVFIHAYSPTVSFADASVGLQEPGLLAVFLRDYSSEVIARISVPLFYIISGFLFFYGFNATQEKFKEKFKSRFWTLVVPYLFWNLLTLFIFWLAQSIPATAIFFSGKNEAISSFSLYDYFRAIFGINRYPISF